MKDNYKIISGLLKLRSLVLSFYFVSYAYTVHVSFIRNKISSRTGYLLIII